MADRKKKSIEAQELAARTRYEELDKSRRAMTAVDLIEWLAQIAHDAKEDWGWIKDELLLRISPEMQDSRAERAPEPEGTRICGNCGLELAETETEEQCRAIFGNLTAEQKAECVAESPSSALEQAHLPIECKRRTCAHHRDIWRHYEDEIASNSELREEHSRRYWRNSGLTSDQKERGRAGRKGNYDIHR